MKLNRKQAPYYDDHDPAKNDMAVLFRPGRPVQGRELNVLQSIQSHQTERLASHIFKNGSRVSGGRCAIVETSYVRLRDTNPDTSENLNMSRFLEGMTIKGDTSKIEAIIVLGLQKEGVDPNTLYVVYQNTAIDGKTNSFIPGENLSLYDENGVVVDKATVRCPSCPGSVEDQEVWPVGMGHIFNVEEGTFYFEGMFIDVASQKCVVSKYSYPKGKEKQPFAGAKIGFDFVQKFVTFEDDTTLLDPSLGYPNSTAPGADRYRVSLILKKRSLDSQDGESFMLLCKIDHTYTIQYLKTDSEYSEIMNMIAKRTYETNGNYTVRPFKVSFLEHKKKSPRDARGWIDNGLEDHLVAIVTPSVAYVKGYRVETIANTPIAFRKARDTSKLPAFIKRFNPRMRITLKPSNSIVWPGDKNATGLVDKTIVRLMDTEGGGGTQIGTARFNDIQHVSGDVTGTDATYFYYLSEIKINVNGKTLKDVKAFIEPDSGFNAAPVLNALGEPSLENTDSSALVFQIEKGNIKSLRDVDNAQNGSLSINVRKKLKTTLDSSGQALFSSLTNEFYEYISPETVCFVTDSSNVTTVIKLDGSNCQVSPTGFTLNLGQDHAGKTVTVIATVLKTNQKEKVKTLTTHTYTTSNWPGNSVGGEVFLGKADALDIVKIEVFDHTNPANPIFVSDVSDCFRLNNGQTDYAYCESSVTQTKEINTQVSGNSRLHVTFRYFEHSGSEGFFTVDSYNGVIADPANNLTYADIPVFSSSKSGDIPLISAFDFRPIMLLDGSMSGTVPANFSTAVFDIEYYLPRTDLLCINKDGKIFVKYGTPSEKPTLPKPDEDSMVLYHIYLQAYTYSLNDVRTKFVENKRYTMRDIGRLEDRIHNLEHITTLSLLEKSAADMSIKDQNGLDRFKNGFVADNFADFQACDVTHLEFRASLDRNRRELRPRFKSKNFKLSALSSACRNVQWHGKVATLPYIEEDIEGNPYATKHISVNPYFVFNRKGTLVLSPNVDTWADENRLPEVVTDIDTGTDAIRRIADAAGLLGTDWGSWIDLNSTIIGTSTDISTTRQVIPRASISPGALPTTPPEQRPGTRIIDTTTETTTTTIQTEQERRGIKTEFDTRVQPYTINDIVKDVQIRPYIRSKVVEFYGSGFLPNTQVFCFFDGVNVSEHCRDASFAVTQGNMMGKISRIKFGTPIYTDENGIVKGEFRIPEGRFFTGKTVFRISNDETGSNDPDMETMSGEATYFSGGLDVTKQDHTLNLITPVITETEVSESRTVTRTESTSVSRSNTTVTPSPPGNSVPAIPAPTRNIIWRHPDPVAQQFFVEEDQMLTGLDLFFKSVDMNGSDIFVEIRQMDNGYPAPGVLTKKIYSPSQLKLFVSDDSTKAFRVNFDFPVFVEKGKDYCFVVGGWSPNTRLWVAKLGQPVVNMPGKIVETQPTLGSSFRSQNNVTWNAEQFETIKYGLRRAKFTEKEMTLSLVNDDVGQEFVRLPINPIETEAGSDKIRIWIPDHGLNTGDKLKLAMYDNSPLTIKVIGLPPQIGQTFTTTSGKGKIVDIQETPITNQYKIVLEGMEGRFLANQSYKAEAMVKHLNDNILFSWACGVGSNPLVINEALGTVVEDSHSGFYLLGKVNGVPVEELNKEHTVVAVDSIDTVIIQVTTPATISQRSGGDAIKAYNSAFKYETMNISGSYIHHSADELWTHEGIYYGKDGSIFEGTDYSFAEAIPITIAADHPLPRPMKISSGVNEIRALGQDGKSVKVTGILRSKNEYVSPIIDTGVFSITAISNRVDWITEETLNVEPNEANRFIPETDPLLGTEEYKYATRDVILANPASDLVIYVDYYKDVNSDFDVYVKRIPVYDPKPSDSTPWMKVNIQDKKNSQSIDEFIEINVNCSDNVEGWKDSSGDDIQFTQFKVKIVGRAKNTAKPPMFKNLRVIAVT